MRTLHWSSPLWLTLLCLAALYLPCSLTHAQSADTPRFIVKWKDHAGFLLDESLKRTENNFYRDTGIHLRHKRNLNNRMAVLQLDQALTKTHIQTTLQELNRQEDVEYAVIDERRFIQSVVPNDPFITATTHRSGQWYLFPQ